MPKALTKQHGALKSVAPALKAIAALRREISTASSLDQLNDISNAAAGLQRRFKPVKEVADEAGLVWTEAEIRLWRELKALEDEVGKAKGTAGRLTGPGRGKKNGGAIVAPPFTADAPTRLELGLGGDAGKKRVARAKKLAEIAGDCWIVAEYKLGDELDKEPKAKGTRGQIVGKQPGTAVRGKGGATGSAKVEPPVAAASTDADKGIRSKRLAARDVSAQGRRRLNGHFQATSFAVEAAPGGAGKAPPDRPHAPRRGDGPERNRGKPRGGPGHSQQVAQH